MSIIFTLIPIAILFVSIAIALFFWAVKTDQFEDLDREGVNILFDEDKPSAEHLADQTNASEQGKPNNG
ncbi:cbb3-type cytochrome oxidase assembly protein CcoS [Motilimonas sp. 1_MG-2023]|uniref:cbb3-type cytochrome oxidase assembly protein CcoS n=1 Tax=Motilimonas TaxID=1914248 RepID=UPI0026E424D4|nr:cbb3-type cytochrome oxidase assembly protein CcoS [Motilimonas sp. 1_MG-2023]MDO6527235.1 cbb3-type cytochrome oxidase assembly protein CcoS [Motilimonas sp. 1_MG-2023]